MVAGVRGIRPIGLMGLIGPILSGLQIYEIFGAKSRGKRLILHINCKINGSGSV